MLLHTLSNVYSVLSFLSEVSKRRCCCRRCCFCQSLEPKTLSLWRGAGGLKVGQREGKMGRHESQGGPGLSLRDTCHTKCSIRVNVWCVCVCVCVCQFELVQSWVHGPNWSNRIHQIKASINTIMFDKISTTMACWEFFSILDISTCSFVPMGRYHHRAQAGNPAWTGLLRCWVGWLQRKDCGEIQNSLLSLCLTARINHTLALTLDPTTNTCTMTG